MEKTSNLVGQYLNSNIKNGSNENVIYLTGSSESGGRKENEICSTI